VPDEIAEIIMERHDTQTAAKIGGYQPPQDKPEQTKPAGLRGLRRA